MSIVKKLTLASGYPKKLGYLSDPPKELWQKGSVDFNGPILAVVGSRKTTQYGQTVTNQLIHSLRGTGVTILSGLALGTDANALRAAMEAKLPVAAVLPCGIDTVYPRTNANLAQQILQSGGALLSEYEGTTRPQKFQFIARNRIVAGLVDAVLIPEAAEKSGSLHTAGFAIDLGVDVLAVPGPINVTTSVGANQLIKNGAQIVTSGLDIVEALGLTAPAKPEQLVFDNPMQQQIYQALQTKPQSIEELSMLTKVSPAELQQALTMMEINDDARCSGGIWSL